MILLKIVMLIRGDQIFASGEFSRVKSCTQAEIDLAVKVGADCQKAIEDNSVDETTYTEIVRDNPNSQHNFPSTQTE